MLWPMYGATNKMAEECRAIRVAQRGTEVGYGHITASNWMGEGTNWLDLMSMHAVPT